MPRNSPRDSAPAATSVVHRANDTPDTMRKRLFDLYFDQGISKADIVRDGWVYGVPLASSTIYELLRQFELCFSHKKRAFKEFEDHLAGRTGPARARGQRAPRVNQEMVAEIGRLLEDDPALFLDEIKVELRPRWGNVSLTTITRVIHGKKRDGCLELSLQVLAYEANQRCRLERQAFLDQIQGEGFPGNMVIAIDESHKVPPPLSSLCLLRYLEARPMLPILAVSGDDICPARLASLFVSVEPVAQPAPQQGAFWCKSPRVCRLNPPPPKKSRVATRRGGVVATVPRGGA